MLTLKLEAILRLGYIHYISERDAIDKPGISDFAGSGFSDRGGGWRSEPIVWGTNDTKSQWRVVVTRTRACVLQCQHSRLATK